MAISTYTNPKTKTIADLKDRVLKLLGYPLITVELTDEQLDFCFDRACEVYTKYASFPTEYLIVNLKDKYVPGDGIDLSEYQVGCVKDFSGMGIDSTGFMTDTIWSLPNAMMASGAYPFFGTGSVGQGAYVTLHSVYEFLDLSRKMQGGVYFDFNIVTQKLILCPEPTDLDRSILICVEKMPDEQTLCGNEYVLRLMLAQAKILLGIVRKKFQNTPLLGGGQIDTTIGDQGQTEWDQLIESIRKDESEGHGAFVL